MSEELCSCVMTVRMIVKWCCGTWYHVFKASINVCQISLEGSDAMYLDGYSMTYSWYQSLSVDQL